MDHTLNEEMARTDLDSLHANLKAKLDGAERLNQIRTNIGDHARILKQSELSMAARSNQIKFALILTRSTRNLDAYRHWRCDPNHPARILKRPSTDLEGVVFL